MPCIDEIRLVRTKMWYRCNMFMDPLRLNRESVRYFSFHDFMLWWQMFWTWLVRNKYRIAFISFASFYLLVLSLFLIFHFCGCVKGICVFVHVCTCLHVWACMRGGHVCMEARSYVRNHPALCFYTFTEVQLLSQPESSQIWLISLSSMLWGSHVSFFQGWN